MFFRCLLLWVSSCVAAWGLSRETHEITEGTIVSNQPVIHCHADTIMHQSLSGSSFNVPESSAKKANDRLAGCSAGGAWTHGIALVGGPQKKLPNQMGPSPPAPPLGVLGQVPDHN